MMDGRRGRKVNLPVHFHTIGGRLPIAPVPEDLPQAVKMASKASLTSAKTLHMATILSSVIHGGALERYPNLRIVLGETGIGWIPYALERMDYEYENRFKDQGLSLKMKPSDYWHRQCRATFQNDCIGTKLLDDLGIENVMWASDLSA
jgi:predicted TIM-barrel fold metal-dependent hydrolase